MSKVVFRTQKPIRCLYRPARNFAGGIHHCLLFVLLCGWSLASGQETAVSENLTSWNSFQNSGNCQIPFALPTQWQDGHEAVAWRSTIEGYGQSSPVIQGSLVVVTSTSGPNKEVFHITGYDLTTGTSLWSKRYENPSPEENNTYVSRAAPTPVIDSKGVYCLHEGGVLVALGLDGNELWQRNLVAQFGPIKARHGLAASLEQDDDRIFVWIERGEAPYLMAVEKKTGETIWKVAGLGSTTWGSPRLVPFNDEHHLVCSASGMVAGFAPETGKKLWEIRDLSNNTSSTPIPAGANRFFIGASDGRGEESSTAANSNGLVEIELASDGTYSAKFLWRAEKASCSFGSPVIAAGRVWIVNRTGALYQLALETGEQLSTSRLKAGSIWSTPLFDDQHLFFFGQKGTTSVVDLTSGKEVASNELWTQGSTDPATSSDQIQYAAAAANGILLIRSGSEIVALR